jgi:hypothetical protein
MANERELDSIIQIDGENYSVVAEKAKRLANGLTIKTIKDGEESTTTFDGSEAAEIEIGDANKIQVTMDDDRKAYATITISQKDPVAEDGITGSIWFKF